MKRNIGPLHTHPDPKLNLELAQLYQLLIQIFLTLEALEKRVRLLENP